MKRSRPIPAGAPGHPKKGGEAGARPRPPKPEKPQAMERKPKAREVRKDVTFIYEDRDIIAVEKPEGLPVIAPEGSRAPCLYDLVTERIRRKNPKGRAAVVHRLDRESSGVLVFGTSGKIKTILMSRWDELARERTYWAVVEGHMEAPEGRLVNYLAEAGPSRMKNVMPDSPGALKAITNYKVLRKSGSYSLLELSLETGRKHQIRAQLSIAGHPIAGDERYGATTDPAGRLCLHAVLLVLEHPSTHEVLRFISPAPARFEEICGARKLSVRDASASASRPEGDGPGPRPPRGTRGGKPSPRPSAPRKPGKGRPGPLSS